MEHLIVETSFHKLKNSYSRRSRQDSTWVSYINGYGTIKVNTNNEYLYQKAVQVLNDDFKVNLGLLCHFMIGMDYP